MKAPEEIALIGGGILLSSGLVFGLKSGAASELPNVSRSVDTALLGKKNADSSSSSSSDSANAANQAATKQKQQEQAQQQAAQKQQAFENSFDGKYQQAQQNHWQIGMWGSAKYYIDNQNNMHIGQGNLNASIKDALGSNASQIQSINFDQTAHAPNDSDHLLAGLSNVNYINVNNLDTSRVTNMSNLFSDMSKMNKIDGINNLNTSNVNNMQAIFSGDSLLQQLDISNWNTSNVTNLNYAFYLDNSLTALNASNLNTNKLAEADCLFWNDYSLKYLNVSNWNISNVKIMGSTFFDNSSLTRLDISSWDNSNTKEDTILYNDVNINTLSLGEKTKLNSNDDLPDSTWKQGNQILSSSQLQDGNAHPGTWYKQ